MFLSSVYSRQVHILNIKSIISNKFYFPVHSNKIFRIFTFFSHSPLHSFSLFLFLIYYSCPFIFSLSIYLNIFSLLIPLPPFFSFVYYFTYFPLISLWPRSYSDLLPCSILEFPFLHFPDIPHCILLTSATFTLNSHRSSTSLYRLLRRVTFLSCFCAFNKNSPSSFM